MLSLPDWSTVNRLDLHNSCGDETSPKCPFPETIWIGGASISGIDALAARICIEILEPKAMFGRPGLAYHENKTETTHVESLLFPRLDEGSIPSNSTIFIIYPIQTQS